MAEAGADCRRKSYDSNAAPTKDTGIVRRPTGAAGTEAQRLAGPVLAQSFARTHTSGSAA